MKIALIGYGKMGRMIETVAQERGHTIVAIVGSDKKIEADTLGSCDVCIDFTTPSSVVDNIQAYVALKKQCVVGTTGWHEKLPEIKQVVESAGIGLLFSPNFSLGVLLFMRLVALAGQLLERFPQYDVAIHEEHHNQKIDRPSGTARALAALLKAELNREPDISSLRCGSIPGVHTVTFDSPLDTLTLTHTARSRRGAAEGAVTAAEWIQTRKGFFTFEDMLENMR
jgi:4-hydroxy-tetrahydrodipicolinate reductase